MRAVFDTNIIIDILNGYELALTEIKRYESPIISRITWIEVLMGAKDEQEKEYLSQFLRCFMVMDTSESIGKQAIILRNRHRLRLPDALIWATAKEQEALLITRDCKDFSENEPDIAIAKAIDT